MLRTRTRVVLIIAAVGLLTVGASWWESARAARSAIASAETMQDELERLRAEADACLDIREQAELRFQALDRETRDIRAQVDSFEALAPPGVPSEAYEAYLERVTTYNESTVAWERQSEELQRFASECDSLVSLHNTGVRELQDFLVSEGVWEEGWIPARTSP